jgi:hypothetical protein
MIVHFVQGDITAKIVAITCGVIDGVKMTIGQFVQNEHGDGDAVW